MDRKPGKDADAAAPAAPGAGSPADARSGYIPADQYSGNSRSVKPARKDDARRRRHFARRASLSPLSTARIPPKAGIARDATAPHGVTASMTRFGYKLMSEEH